MQKYFVFVTTCDTNKAFVKKMLGKMIDFIGILGDTPKLSRFYVLFRPISHTVNANAQTKNRKEAFMSELIRLFSTFGPFFERCLVLRRSSADDVGLPGFEPRMTGPESVVLPLHHSPMLVCECKSRTYFFICKEKCEKFVYLLKIYAIFT